MFQDMPGWAPLGPGHAHRFFEKGALKFVILDLLKDRPAHGYELIRAMEERSQGFYTPSAGSIYPTLQLLEDMGLVTAAESNGKKVYTLTDAGRAYLKEHGDIVTRLKAFARHRGPVAGRADWRETFEELRGLGLLFRRRFQELDSEQVARIRQVVSRAVREIEDIIESRPKTTQ